MYVRIASLLFLLVGCSEAASTPKDGSVSDSPSFMDGGGKMDAMMGSDGETSLCGHTLLDPKKSALVVNEMQAKGMEFFEIFNTSSNAVDLSGMSAADTDDDGGCPKTSAALLFPNGTSLAGGGYIVVYTGQPDAGACGDAGCFNATYKISNGNGETIFVLDGTGAVTTSGTYPPSAAPSGKSWSRLPNGSGDFTVATPTPGAANMP